MLKFFNLLFLHFLMLACSPYHSSTKSQYDSGILIVQDYFLNTPSTSKKMQEADTPDRIFYYKNYLIEETFTSEQIRFGDQAIVRGTDTCYYFIDIVSGKCDRYEGFSENARKTASMKWKDKPEGLKGFQDMYDSIALNVNTHTVFTDTSINNKSYRFCTLQFEPKVKLLYNFEKSDTTGFQLMKRCHPLGAMVRVDAIDESSGAGGSTTFEFTPRNLTKSQIDVFEAWIKNSAAPPVTPTLSKTQKDSLVYKKMKALVDKLDSLHIAGASDSTKWEAIKKLKEKH